MKIKLIPIMLAVYFLLAFLLIRTFSFYPVIIFAIVAFLDYFTGIKSEIKNLLYILAAFSVFFPIFGLFLLYLPFAVFGVILKKRSFVRSYIMGYGISFIPSIFIYLVSTYLRISLNYIAIAVIFYILPLLAFLILKKKSVELFHVDRKEASFILIALFFTSLIAYGIVDGKSLFMSNGTREFARLQPAVEGLKSSGLLPLYEPGTGHGEPTYLWVPPSHISNFFTVNYLLGFFSPILFFNSYSFFILLLSTLALGILFSSMLGKESEFSWLAVAAITLSIGLNFIFLQKVEAIKEFSAFPIAYLFLALILDNPGRFNEYLVLMFFSAILMTIHPAYGFEILLIAIGLFLFRKFYMVKDRSEIKNFFRWIVSNKAISILTVIAIIIIPLFYFSNSIVYKDFLRDLGSKEFTVSRIGTDAFAYLREFFDYDVGILSRSYPDVARIDDHKIGPFLSVFGIVSLVIVNFMFRKKELGSFFAFEGAVAFKVVLLALIAPRFSFRFGGLFRTNKWFLLILLGAAMLVMICMISKKHLKLVAIAAVAIAFLHAIPYAGKNITNIHKEMIMSGEVYKDEINFIRQLPVDGRIMTYGLFANAVDFGLNSLTGRYFSRDEREEVSYYERAIYNRIHTANSFGDTEILSSMPGAELYNYLRIGGYKYLFLNICHPAGDIVVKKVYPNFSYPIYQNTCMAFLVVNGTSYVEKVDIAELDGSVYKAEGGYKYISVLGKYGFENDKLGFSKNPKEPEPLQFERISREKVRILGNFYDNDWVLFKERYWPRWKAYMNGKEVPVYPSNDELLLVKAEKGSEMMLEYSLLKKEKIFGILSLIGILVLSSLFVFSVTGKIPEQ